MTTIRPEIVSLADSLRGVPQKQKSFRLAALMPLCASVEECAYLAKRAAFDTKTAPGTPPNPEIHVWAERVVAHMEAHNTKVKAAARALLPKGFLAFDAVCKRAYHLQSKRKKSLCGAEF